MSNHIYGIGPSQWMNVYSGTTVTLPGSVQQKVPEMPKALENNSFEDIQAAFSAMQNSQIVHLVNTLNSLTDKKLTLKQWEVDEVERAFKKFLAQQNSPLVKALK